MVVVRVSVMTVAGVHWGVDDVAVDVTSMVPLTLPAFGIWHSLKTMVTPARVVALGEPVQTGAEVFGLTVTVPGQTLVSPRASARMRSPTDPRELLVLPASPTDPLLAV